MTKDISSFIAKRDALYRNPTLEAATALYPGAGDPLFPLAMLHKSRMHWIEATDEMLAESRAWMKENGFDVRMRGGATPLTPATRDLQRIQRGLLPLSLGKRR